jgi:glycosyltransferase involved in cell wall biosynthesis
MKKIKVLHTITRLGIGGATENTLLCAQLLDNSKYEVDVICGDLDFGGATMQHYAKKNGIRVRECKNLVREISLLKDIKHVFEMKRILLDGKYDIIHTHSSKAGILHRLAAKMSGTPIIVHSVHGWSFHDYMSKVKKQLFVLLERHCAKLSDALITVTKFDTTKGLQNKIGLKEKYTTIHSSIEIDTYSKPSRKVALIKEELGLPTDKIIIGTVSRMSAQKAPMDFLRLVELVCKVRKDVHFLFIGGGELDDAFAEKAEEMKLKDVITAPGFRHDVPDMLHVMDIFVLTSLWEGLPRVFSQAMAAKLPVVATRVDGAPEIIDEGVNGYMVNPGDMKSMAQKVNELLENPSKITEFGTCGFERIQQDFDVNVMVAKIDELYRKIQKGKNL